MRGMIQTVKEPTRTTFTSSTLIDLAFANIDLEASVQNTPKVSDHAVISIKLKNKNRVLKKIIKKRNFKNFDDLKFVNSLENKYNNVNFTLDNDNNNINNNDNLNSKENKLIYNISKTLDELAPVLEIVVKNKEKPWFT